MKDKTLTNEQTANYDKIKFYYNEKIVIHLTLNRLTLNNDRYYYNGTIVQILDNNIFTLQDLKTNELINFSIFELKDGGVSPYTKK